MHVYVCQVLWQCFWIEFSVKDHALVVNCSAWICVAFCLFLFSALFCFLLLYVFFCSKRKNNTCMQVIKTSDVAYRGPEDPVAVACRGEAVGRWPPGADQMGQGSKIESATFFCSPSIFYRLSPGRLYPLFARHYPEGKFPSQAPPPKTSSANFLYYDEESKR